MLDKRGVGLSERLTGMPTLEQRMDDVRAVMDAVGLERAVLMGVSEGGQMNMLFAATYPERVTALVLYATSARGTRTADYPYGPPPELIDQIVEQHLIEQSLGYGGQLRPHVS